MPASEARRSGTQTTLTRSFLLFDFRGILLQYRDIAYELTDRFVYNCMTVMTQPT